MRQHQTKMHLYNEETYWQNEKTTYRMREDICKWLSDKGRVSKLYHGLIQLNIKKKKKTEKWTEDLSGHFSKMEMQAANRHMKRCSTSGTMKEMQIITSVRYHLTPARMVIIKKNTHGDFPDGPVTKTPHSQCWGPGFGAWVWSLVRELEPTCCN